LATIDPWLLCKKYRLNTGFISFLWIFAKKMEEPFTQQQQINPKLIEHVFRSVWEAQLAQDKENEKADAIDGDDGDNEIEAAGLSRSPQHVTKIQQETLKLAAEYLRLFLIEALNRAKLEAIVDDSPTVEPHHVEQIVAQLLLDF
jgi:centromere protein X